MRSTKILVVEDESITAKDIQETLKGYGYEVPAVVLSGEEAIEKAEQLQPDLVLMDIVLKGDVDGIEAAEQIFQRFGIPVVYLTAYADGKMVKRAKITEPFGYIIKPFEERQLHTNVEMALYKRKMEKLLEASEKKYRDFFKTCRDCVFVTSKDERWLDMNDAAVQFFGYSSREELQDVRIQQLYANTADRKKHIRKIEQDGYTKGYPVNLRKKDGSIINTLISSVPVRDESGKVTGYQGVIRDITERKRVEERLQKYQGRLKSLASELTFAEEREKRRIATWLHDRLSQSLVSCKLRLETVDRSAASAEVARAMAETGKTLGDALEEVREMTFELGSPILHELGFETAVKDWLREKIQEKHGLETEFEDDGREKIMNDDVRAVLFRDVRELLVNVVKYARAKKVKVAICKTNKHITVGVEDDGCGFDSKKIYESKTGKIGYGLFSIKERLEELGGHLDVKSRPGKGVLVTLSAPLKQ